MKRVVTWIVVLLLLAGGVGALVTLVSRGRESDPDWQRGQEAIADYDFANAQRHLVNYVTRWRQDAVGHLMLARCYRRAPAADLESASNQLKAAEELGGHAEWRELEADLLDYQQLGRPPQLGKRLEAYLESRPEDRPLIYEALARGAIRDGRLNTANQWLDRWVAEYPDDWWARLWRGTLFQHMDRPQLAIQDYRFAMSRRPDDPQMAKRLGMVLATSGFDYEQAEQLLGGYVAEYPDDADALAALARCRRAGGDNDKALETAEQALRIDSQHADALLTRTLLELEMDQPEQAFATMRQLKEVAREFRGEEGMQRLLALQPVLQNPHLTQRAEEILHLEAKILRQLDREQEAQERLERLATLQRQAAELKKLLVEYRDRRDDADLIYRILERYLDIGQPREAEAWLRRLELVNAGDSRISDAEKAIREQRP